MTESPKAAPPSSVLWIYEDPARDLALIRGKNVRVILDLAVIVDHARWSPSGKGFVVPLAHIPDVVAASQYADIPVRFKQVGEAA